MKKKTSTTAEDIYTTSFYFFNASIRCWRVERNSNGVAKTLFIAAMANAAFACELAVKSIYFCKNNEELTGHDLFSLISKLSTDIRTEIYSNLSDKGYDQAENLIKQYGKSFVEWRYLHEFESNCYAFDKDLLLNLYLTLEKVYNTIK